MGREVGAKVRARSSLAQTTQNSHPVVSRAPTPLPGSLCSHLPVGAIVRSHLFSAQSLVAEEKQKCLPCPSRPRPTRHGCFPPASPLSLAHAPPAMLAFLRHTSPPPQGCMGCPLP